MKSFWDKVDFALIVLSTIICISLLAYNVKCSLMHQSDSNKAIVVFLTLSITSLYHLYRQLKNKNK